MNRSGSSSYAELRQHLEKVPVIETHEHYSEYADHGDALGFILDNYYHADYLSAGGEESFPEGLSAGERLDRFLNTFGKSNKTAYARGMLNGLRQCWGVEKLETREDFLAFEARFASRDVSIYEKTMDRLGIRAKIVDSFSFGEYLAGQKKGSKYARFAFPLPDVHNLHGFPDVMHLQAHLDRPIVCLDDYTEAFERYFERCVDFGIVCLKDQSAYRRDVAYGNPAKAEAEKAFNDIIFHPREIFGDDRVRPLDDWLFQYAMRLAAGHNLPVQLHTGHMAGIRNEIAKTNAVNLIPTIELHRNVRFGLFHGNWPYMDEYLFIGKNYPNVWLDLCWVQCIDPVYCVELMKRAVMTVPHSKIFAFGGDTGAVEWVAGYLELARDNVACALSELTDSGWLSMSEAKRLAADWFFNNPNDFFALGFDRV